MVSFPVVGIQKNSLNSTDAFCGLDTAKLLEIMELKGTERSTLVF